MNKICAWCQRPLTLLTRLFQWLGLERRVSHGVCPDCNRLALARIGVRGDERRRRR